MYSEIEVSEVSLTPYKEAPALKVSLKAKAAKVVYPPAEPPVIQSRSPSTFPLFTYITDYIAQPILEHSSVTNVGKKLRKIPSM